MAENLDISVILEKSYAGDARVLFVEALLGCLSEIVGMPQSVAIQSLVSQHFDEVQWPAGRHLLKRKLDSDQLLHIYGKSYGTAKTSVTIEDDSAITIYTIGLPTCALVDLTEETFISILQDIYSLSSIDTQALVFAGIESTVGTSSNNLRQIAQVEMRKDDDLHFAVGSNSVLSHWDDSWRQVHEWNDNVVLMRDGIKLLRSNH